MAFRSDPMMNMDKIIIDLPNGAMVSFPRCHSFEIATGAYKDELIKLNNKVGKVREEIKKDSPPF